MGKEPGANVGNEGTVPGLACCSCWNQARNAMACSGFMPGWGGRLVAHSDDCRGWLERLYSW